MNLMVWVAIFVLVIFVGMLAMLEVGWRVKLRRMARRPDMPENLGVVEGAIMGLFGLIIAFTFSGAAERFDARKQLVVEESNAIGTAYLRIDLLSPNAQASLKDGFREYLDCRLSAYAKLPDIAAAFAELERAKGIQDRIWVQAVAACKNESTPQATMLLLPAMNEMFDMATTRTMVAQMHPPLAIFAMLGFLAMACSLIAGYGMAGRQKKKSLIHMVGFAIVITAAIFVILDMEYPRVGFITVDAIDRSLIDVRQSMK